MSDFQLPQVVDTTILGRELTKTEYDALQSTINAYNGESSTEPGLMALLLGPNFRVSEAGSLSGFVAMFRKDSRVRPDLIKPDSGLYRTRAVYRVSSNLSEAVSHDASLKEELSASVPEEADLESSFGAHMFTERGTFNDASAVPTIGSEGCVGFQYHMESGITPIRRNMIVADVVPEALRRQAEAHIDEAVSNGQTFAEMLSSDNLSLIDEAMGTKACTVFGQGAHVGARCAQAAVLRAAEIYGAEFHEQDYASDTMAVNYTRVPQPMAVNTTNYFVEPPAGTAAAKIAVYFYSEMISTQKNPVVIFKDTALGGFHLIAGPASGVTSSKPQFFNASAWRNIDTLDGYPSDVAIRMSAVDVPVSELNFEGIKDTAIRNAAEKIFTWEGAADGSRNTAAFSTCRYFDADLNEQTLTEHNARITKIREQCSRNALTQQLSLAPCVMKVGSVHPDDLPLYPGDVTYNEGEARAAYIGGIGSQANEQTSSATWGY